MAAFRQDEKAVTQRVARNEATVTRFIQGASKKCHGFKHLPFPNYLTYILLLFHVW